MREFCITSSSGTGSTVTASGTAVLIWANPSTAPAANLEFLRFWAGYSTNATSAQQRVTLVSATSSFPQVGTPVTPNKLKVQDTASVIVADSTGTAGTCAINCSTYNSATFSLLHQDAFNVLNGWLIVPTPAETRIFPANSATSSAMVGMGLWFPVTPTTTTGWAWGCNYREI